MGNCIGPEPNPAVDSSSAPRMEPQPAATTDAKCSQDFGASPATPASTVLVPAQKVLLPSDLSDLYSGDPPDITLGDPPEGTPDAPCDLDVHFPATTLGSVPCPHHRAIKIRSTQEIMKCHQKQTMTTAMTTKHGEVNISVRARVMEKYSFQYNIMRHAVALSEGILKSAPATILHHKTTVIAPDYRPTTQVYCTISVHTTTRLFVNLK
ncbi:uncharacterized protein LOC115192539 isoform X1 [Salmo trutta]|uniref:uncharacterized protein LOC115192539 isoform X1 n=1 Tax=Salmo trutta TaxID=8032 RepID=UPI00113174E3|nr:uncharacterized protein LOC115192539 isoform X1 [Salmo trutta]